jgi:hypothetical protein
MSGLSVKDVVSTARRSERANYCARNRRLVKRSIILSLALGMAALGSCSNPVDCSGGNFRNGCIPGTVGLAATKPRTVAPSATSPGTASPGTASPGTLTPGTATPGTATPGTAGPGTVRSGTVSLGDPSEFADVDDKQCRSYGLIFGTRDYADCRIRLSAQHRGLDPNLGRKPFRAGQSINGLTCVCWPAINAAVQECAIRSLGKHRLPPLTPTSLR